MTLSHNCMEPEVDLRYVLINVIEYSYLEVLYSGGGQRGIRLRPYTRSTSTSIWVSAVMDTKLLCNWWLCKHLLVFVIISCFSEITVTMADNEQKAIDLMSQAEKKLKSTGGFFGSLFG